MSMRSAVVLGLALTACNQGGPPDDAVTLDWGTGELFYVGASYRIANVKTVDMATELEDPQADFDHNWSDEVVWTYQVVETGLVPDPSDELYEYAVRADGSIASLSVVRAFLDPALNGPNELGSADPVVYLVFLEDRDRLAAIISFTDLDGERVEQAWTSKELGKSWSALSQSMLTAAPTYLAPFAARFADETKVLENGSLLDTVTVDDGVVDTYYDDELGGGLVMSRYEAGEPWPTVTVADNVESRLLTSDEVAARRADLPFMVPNPPPPFDFRAALASKIDIESALTLDAQTMGGGFTAEVREGYRPWAGDWWSLRKGALVFGFRGSGPTTDDTISDRGYAQFKPLKKDLEILSDSIRTMAEGSAKEAKRAEYTTKQKAFVDALVVFYDGILQGLRGGTIVVENDRIRHTTQGWSYDIDTLSPMDKMALVLYLDGKTSPNPFYMSAWELLNSWAANEGGDNSWWGHCNGWAAAAILENEPRTAVTFTKGGHEFTFDTADLKGLTSEAHYSVYSRFYGSRYYKEGDDISDLSPKAFHQLVTFYFRDQGVPLVFDTTADAAVWNFPAWGAEIAVEETTVGGGAGKINVNTADIPTLDTLPGIGPSTAAKIIAYREANGPFQVPEDLKKVSGIGTSTYAGLASLITVTVTSGERTFDVVAEVQFSTDGVPETHLDSGTRPNGFVETYRYELVTDANGRVLRGTWDDVKKHPDFAWIPYNNPTTAASNSSENPYLVYADMVRLLGDRRRK